MRELSEWTGGRGNYRVIDFSLLTVFWLLSLVVVNPTGNFPLNDDWSYALTVKHLLATGNYQPTGWAAMTLVVNVLWGAAFCLFAGFSFVVLRFSTLFASWLGILSVYWLMRECRQPRGVALIATLVFAFDPVYYVLSNTFMTDVLFIDLAVLAAIFFLKDLERPSNATLFLAMLFSLAAVMSRQIGLAVPLAFAIVSILQQGVKARAVLRGVVPLMVCVVALIAFEQWLSRTGRLPALYNYKTEKMAEALGHPVKLAGVFAHSIYLCLMYLGLALSPILCVSLARFRSIHKHWWGLCAWLAAALTGLTIVNGLCHKGFTMPLSTNLLIRSGLGPVTLRDTFEVNASSILPESFWLAVTLISVAGAAVLACQIIFLAVEAVPKLFPFRLERSKAGGLFLVLAGLAYLLPFFVNGFIDRHLLPAVPFLMAGALMHLPQSAAQTRTQPRTIPAGFAPATLAGALLLAGFIGYSVCGTRDYLAWNRARWVALNDLMQQDKVQPSAIDGGFEFNGYYLYRPDPDIDSKKSGWWVVDDAYLINFQQATNYSVYRTYPYTHWMPPYTAKIYVLKRDGASDLPNGHGP